MSKLLIDRSKPEEDLYRPHDYSNDAPLSKGRVYMSKQVEHIIHNGGRQRLLDEAEVLRMRKMFFKEKRNIKEIHQVFNHVSYATVYCAIHKKYGGI